MSLERCAELLRGGRHTAGPFKVGLVAQVRLDECLTRHAAPVDGDLQDAALDRPNLGNLFVHTGAQTADGSGGKADWRQFALDFRAHLRDGGGTSLVCMGPIRQPLEPGPHTGENREAVVFELFETGRVRLVRILGVSFDVVAVQVVAGSLCFHVIFVGLRCRPAFVCVAADAIDEFVDTQFAGNDAVHIGKNHGHDRWTRGDCLDHVLHAVFDAFRDLDFAGARQQFAGAHFTHVHPDGISGAAELRIDGRQSSLRFLVHLIVRCHGRRAVVQQERLRIRRLLVHGHTHVAERADDGLHCRSLRKVAGQVIVDVRMGKVAALTPKRDQRAHLALTRFVLVRRRLFVRRCCDGPGYSSGRAATGF